MRYFTSVVSPSFHVPMAGWSFQSVKYAWEIPLELRRFGILFSSYILRDGQSGGGRPGDYNLENATRVAFFMAYSSKYADYHTWTDVREWYGQQTPAVQSMLVKARVWFQKGCRANFRNPQGTIASKDVLVVADLNTGVVLVGSHMT